MYVLKLDKKRNYLNFNQIGCVVPWIWYQDIFNFIYMLFIWMQLFSLVYFLMSLINLWQSLWFYVDQKSKMTITAGYVFFIGSHEKNILKIALEPLNQMKTNLARIITLQSRVSFYLCWLDTIAGKGLRGPRE